VGLFSMFNFSLAIFFIYCLSIWKKEKMQMNLPPPSSFSLYGGNIEENRWSKL
jgi:hypothetical protein